MIPTALLPVFSLSFAARLMTQITAEISDGAAQGDSLRCEPELLSRFASPEAVELWQALPLNDEAERRGLADRLRRARDPFLAAAAAVLTGVEGGMRPEEVLIDRMWSYHPRDRMAAAILIGCLKEPAALEGLYRCLWDDHPHVQVAAIYALTEIGDTAAIPPLVNLLYRCKPKRTHPLRHASLVAGMLTMAVSVAAPVTLGWRHEYGLSFLSGLALCGYAASAYGLVFRSNFLLPHVAFALTKLGDTEHAAEMRETVRELRDSATSRKYSAKNRELSSQLADFIEGELSRAPDLLPIPSTTTSGAPDLLPRPALPRDEAQQG